jgi:hypothetical protein
MRPVRTTIRAVALLGGACPFAAAQEPVIQTSQVLNDQWFTGSLVSPSPALPKAGLIAIEPYEQVTLDNGSYLSNGQKVGTRHPPRFETVFSLVEYGITDRLSIQALPGFNYGWNDVTTTRGLIGADLPVDLKYRFVDQVANTAIPSATFSLGISFPTGPYNQLGSGLEGAGTGVWFARQGGVLQWLVNTYDNHPLRIRLWGGLGEPLNNPTLNDISSYGTGPGFHGALKPGLQASWGISPEYALSQRWVLAFDLYGTYGNTGRINGFSGLGGFLGGNLGTSTRWAAGPAIEYNWSPRFGIIAGVLASFAGHNNSSYIAPQIAINMVF